MTVRPLPICKKLFASIDSYPIDTWRKVAATPWRGSVRGQQHNS